MTMSSEARAIRRRLISALMEHGWIFEDEAEWCEGWDFEALAVPGI